MYQTNCNEEVSIKILGKLTLDIPEVGDLEQQLKIKEIIDKVLNNYDVMTKEKALITSDIEDKIKMFIACRSLDRLSNETLKNYKYVLIKFSNYFHKPLVSISTMDIRIYLEQIGNNLKSGSLNTVIYILKTFFSWCVEEDYLVKNPMNKIHTTKVPKRIRTAMTDEQSVLLQEGCTKIREKAVLTLLLSTGIRVSEIIKLNKSDINWTDLCFYIIGKGNKQRKVYFDARAKVALKEYLESRKDSEEALFVGVKSPHKRVGQRTIQIEIKKILSKSKLDINVYPHLCRHTFGTSKINSGMPLSVLQELMGHENPSTTLIYSKMNDDNIKYEYKKSC